MLRVRGEVIPVHGLVVRDHEPVVHHHQGVVQSREVSNHEHPPAVIHHAAANAAHHPVIADRTAGIGEHGAVDLDHAVRFPVHWAEVTRHGAVEREHDAVQHQHLGEIAEHPGTIPTHVAVVLLLATAIPILAGVIAERLAEREERVLRMANPAPENVLALDLKPFRGFLIDLPAGARVGMRKVQEGWAAVVAEIVANQAEHGEHAGISQSRYQRLMTLEAQYAALVEALPAVKSAVRVLEDTLANLDSQRHRLCSAFASAAESHARLEGGDPALLTAYEKTIAYRGRIAAKAAHTKKRKAAGEAEASAAEAGVAGAPRRRRKKGELERKPIPAPEMVFALELGPLRGVLIELPSRARRGMRTVQEGWTAVVAEIVDHQAQDGERAGITAADFARFLALEARYAEVAPLLPAALKAREVVEETLAHLDSQRHHLVTYFADSAEEHAKLDGGDPTLITAYEKTIAYRGVVARKAARTRKKKREGT